MKKNNIIMSLFLVFLSSISVADNNQPFLTKDDSFTIDLLENKNEDLAIKYFHKNEEIPNKLYGTENGNVTSDIIVAFENSQDKYIQEILPMVEGINNTFRYDNKDNFTLFMVFAKSLNIENKEKIMDIFVKKGVNHSIKNSMGETAFDIAYKNNNYFFKELYLIKAGDEKIGLLLSNDELKNTNKKLQSKIVSNLNNGLLDDLKKDKEKLFETYIDFIVSGYNEAAFILESEIENFEKENKRGVTPLMASAISIIDGGNVEYAKRLIEKGVNINQKTERSNGATALMLSMVKDNYKVATLLFLNNVDYKTKDKNGNNVFEYAIKYNAIKSMIIIKTMFK